LTEIKPSAKVAQGDGDTREFRYCIRCAHAQVKAPSLQRIVDSTSMSNAALNILAISGSARQASTNTAFLHAMRDATPEDISLGVFHRLDRLPVFCPDLEGSRTPAEIEHFMARIAAADGIIFSSPEYVRAIPGGLKNAIDWMVSRHEIIAKPIALAHASHRGDDMLASLRLVLSTVSSGFLETAFLRVPLMGQSPDAIAEQLKRPDHAAQIKVFLSAFATHIRTLQAAKAWQAQAFGLQ